MKVSLECTNKQSQNMTMSQRVVQQLKILQMPLTDLEQHIEETVNENPVLEIDTTDETITFLNNYSSIRNIRNRITTDTDYKRIIDSASVPVLLKDFLHQQLLEMKLDSESKTAAKYIIESLNKDGYISESLQNISQSVYMSPAIIKQALKVVQSMDPAGVGARSLKECLILQLKRNNLYTCLLRDIIKEYFELLAGKCYSEIAKKSGIDKITIIEACKVIQKLNPKPGQNFTSESTNNYIIPELSVKRIGSDFFVIFNDERIPNLKLSNYYKQLLNDKHTEGEAVKYIKTKYSEAIELFKAIEQRKSTVLKTAQFIVDFQRDFLKQGYMRPLTMKVVAEALGMHESTISRTVNNKYMQTPRGLFELKFFFTAGIETSHEGMLSANTIKEIIKKTVSEEDKNKPLSDEQIKKLLDNKGITIARRTVSKYREELSILPSSIRKE